MEGGEKEGKGEETTEKKESGRKRQKPEGGGVSLNGEYAFPRPAESQGREAWES